MLTHPFVTAYFRHVLRKNMYLSLVQNPHNLLVQLCVHVSFFVHPGLRSYRQLSIHLSFRMAIFKIYKLELLPSLSLYRYERHHNGCH
jgi:hypothetical protein